MSLLDGWLIAELLLLGSVGGFLAGLLGIGGGMILVPFTSWILSSRGVESGLALKMAVATSMAMIVFTSASSVRAHHQRSAVRWDLVRGLAPGIVVGGLIGAASVFVALRGATLAMLFGVFVAFMATQMLLDRKPKPSRQMPGPAGSAAAGGLISFVSGMVGAGGAFISVPFMSWCNVPVHNAVATSAALGLPIALANVAGYLIGGRHFVNPVPGSFGYLWLPGVALLASASVLCAPLGARLSYRLDVRQLKRLFALLLYGIAAHMLWRAAAGG